MMNNYYMIIETSTLINHPLARTPTHSTFSPMFVFFMGGFQTKQGIFSRKGKVIQLEKTKSQFSSSGFRLASLCFSRASKLSFLLACVQSKPVVASMSIKVRHKLEASLPRRRSGIPSARKSS